MIYKMVVICVRSGGVNKKIRDFKVEVKENEESLFIFGDFGLKYLGF